MGDTRAVLRLGLAPALLLAWNLWSGDILPYLGAMLAVTLLMPGGQRPPLKALLGALLLVAAVTLTLVIMFRVVGESPGSVWLALLALCTACFAQLAVKPDHIPSLLALITAVLVTTLIRTQPSLAVLLPWAMLIAALQAVGVVLLAHALLPSKLAAPAKPAARQVPANPGLRAFLKALALVAPLMLAVAAGEASGILVAITLANLLREPGDAQAIRYGRNLVLANLVAAAIALPVLGMAALRPMVMMLLPMGLAASLMLAAATGRDGRRGVVAQLGLPVFLLLMGQLLPTAGDEALGALWERLFFLGLAVGYGMAVLVLLRPRNSWGVTKALSPR